MTIARAFSILKTLLNTSLAIVTLSVVTLSIATPHLFAQTTTEPTTASLTLPDAPGFTSTTPTPPEFSSSSSSSDGIAALATEDPDDSATASSSRRRLHLASRREITIQPGQIAPSIDARDKFILGVKESFTLFSVIGWTTSAGYSQIVNGTPNYGTDSGAFGMRLGATALRNTSENILGDAIFAPIFHDDPRYYKLGKDHNFVKRGVYAATRALITKSDSGNTRPNYSLLSGNLAGAILTNAYYPKLNQGFDQTAKTFGTSVGGSAIGFVVTEFLDDMLDLAHLKRLE